MRSLPAAAALLAAALSACVTATPPSNEQPIPAAWLSVPAAASIGEISYQGGMLVHAARARPAGAIHVVESGDGVALANGDKVLTPAFRAIDSFDLSAERKEVVFSAKRAESFDVGLVSADGSDVHWVPSDPADEIAVQWAPRGNKFSYVVRAKGGDLVRSVHVPTSMQLSVEFPDGLVRDVAWEPKGERFAAVWQSVDASDRVEEMRFGGEERRVVEPPAVRLDVAVEPLEGAALLRPATIRYGEKLPLVVWRASSVHAWDDARAALERRVRVACAVVEGDPTPAFWAAIQRMPWIDTARVYAVEAAVPGAALTITGDATLPAGKWRKEGRVVRVSTAVVKSFAAGFLGEELKGSLPANANRR